jgi:hypothetical protein
MEKDAMQEKRRATGCGAVVEHLSHHPKVEGLSPAESAGNGRGKWKKDTKQEKRKANGCGAVVEHLLCHPEVEGLSPANSSGTRRDKWKKMLCRRKGRPMDVAQW